MPSSPGYVKGPTVIPVTFQVVLNWTLPNGVKASNVLHAIIPADEVPTQDLADGVFIDLSTATDFVSYLNYVSDATTFDNVSIKNLQVEKQVAFQSTGDPVSGASAEHALPEEVAFCVTLRTDKSGPAHRGRIYLGGLAVNAVGPLGLADSDFAATARVMVGSIKTVFTTHGMSLGIGHRGHASYPNVHGDTVDAEEPGTDPVLSIVTVDNKFDSQRRRK